MRLFISLILVLLLSACVLSSKTPKFAGEDTAMPIAADGQFDAYTKDGENWKKEEEALGFKHDGNRYLMSDGKTTASVVFIALKPQWFAAQYRENATLYYYGLVKTTGDELEVSPLPCDKLKPLVDMAAGVVFTGDDCSIDGVADPKAFFAALIDKLPAPTSKLVPRK
jgi:hypothetical protein